MSNPTSNDVQAVSAVLTNMLVGYMQAEARFVADRVFPGVAVDKKDGTFYKFTKKYWFANEMQPRAHGAPFSEGEYGVETDTYATLQYALQKAIADEDRANSQVPMDLEQAAVRWLAQQMLIKKEVQFSTDFMKTSVWGTDNTTANDWDDYESGDPAADVNTARQTIGKNTGQDPNTLVCGQVVWDALKLHPDILDRIKYTTAATSQNVASAVGGVLEIPNILVSRASYTSTNLGQSSITYSAIVDDDALICYVEPGVGNLMSASAGKTFYWQPGGGLGSILPVERVNLRKADVIMAQMEWDQKCTASDLGYFFSDIV